MTASIQRVAAYVDGFNLYYGLRSKGWRRYYWLDLSKLVGKLLRSGQQLVAIRYFTARVLPVAGDQDKPTRQGAYLEALATLSNLEIQYGYFLQKESSCHRCGAIRQTYEEKMTDVNIAVSLLADAQDGIYDTAMVISGDSDLSGPIEEVRQRYPSKRVVVAFPPERVSKELRKGGPSFTIGRDAFRDSQFPDQIISPTGRLLIKPVEWN